MRKAKHHQRNDEESVTLSFATAILSLIAAHLIPVSAAILLVSLNIHGYYIGGELAGPSGYDDIKLSGLQFAAKLHEITIQGSLSAIVIGLIRQELIAGEGIPFGAIFGSLQFADISYLYSREFAGTLRAKFAKRIVKIRLTALLIVGSVLALTVGPSSAIAMRPRVDNWPAGGTDFYLNATVEEIWPSLIDASTIPTSCSSITSDTTCISKDWESVVDQLLAYWPQLTNEATMPESLQVHSPKSVRQMYTRETRGIYAFFETVATTQMSNLADSLAEVGRLWAIAANQLQFVSPKQPRKFMYRYDAIYSIKDVYQPITTAICRGYPKYPLMQKILLNNTLDVPIPASLCNETRHSSPLKMQPAQSEMISRFITDNTTYPEMQFVELPPELFGNNSIGALITFPSSWPGGPNLLTCAVDARWTPVTLQSTRNVMKVVTGQPLNWPGRGVCMPSLPSINITSEWAQYLNPYIQDTNKTVFHTLIESAGIPASQWEDNSGFVQGIMETILTSMVTNGLPLTASSATIQGQLNDCPNNNCDESCGLWCLDIMPKSNQEFGYGGDIYNLSGISDVSKLSRFTVHVDVNGYAYNIKGATMILSCVVLLCYSALVIAHSVFVLIKKTSSNAWDSVSEVTALAMQSQPTEVLRNTGAGISTTRVFSNLVKVVRTGAEKDHLELDFGDHGSNHSEALVEGEFYS